MAAHPVNTKSTNKTKKGMTKTFHGSDKQVNSMDFSKTGDISPMSKTFHGSDANPLTMSFEGTGVRKPMSPTFPSSDANPLSMSFGQSK